MRYLLIGLLLVCHVALAQPDPFPNVATSYLVQVNASLLWEKQANRRLPPASLTKLMTVLLVLDDYKPKAVAEISQRAAQETGMRLGAKRGERFYVEDLLSSALINSDNDACHALAEFIGGNHQQFVQMMNRRAQQLGLRNTHFSNACGHDAADHYSTAHDLAVLANEVLKHHLVTELVVKESAQIFAIGGKTGYQLQNKNALIGRYQGALGLKTGYTPKAGKCLIAYAERDGARVLLVMLNAPNRWWDAVDLLDLAFAQARHAS
ncbi:MAG TPA: D-alanyl-D-alanine carboxypeptidase family protein [Gallionellaceae bacterium]|nr:D-alanyl-D-alanine carboxypeptidase family protein [Gallionellaceae bacterium]